MTTIVFYEKPGCGTNARQRRLLEASGHSVIARNLITEPWTAERLLSFFGDSPVESWFNPAAPAVKSGAVNPAGTDSATAIALMLVDPLLIRRPLLEALGERRAGFNPDLINAWVGLNDLAEGGPDPQRCSRPEGSAPCPDPGTRPERVPR